MTEYKSGQYQYFQFHVLDQQYGLQPVEDVQLPHIQETGDNQKVFELKYFLLKHYL